MDAAASMIEKAIIANPTYAEAYNNLGLYLASFVVPKYIIIAGHPIKLYKSIGSLHNLIIYHPPPFCSGVLYRDAGNISMAITAYEQCLKIDPDSRNAGQVPFQDFIQFRW